jgi:hypothetical protein
MLVVNRRGRAGKMPDPIHLEADGLRDIVTDQLKTWVAKPLSYIEFATREIVIETDHLLAGLHQAVDQV